MAAITACWPHSKLDTRDSTGVWSNALYGLTHDQIKAGISALSTTGKAHPPAPGEFREKCSAVRAVAPDSTWRWAGFTSFDDWYAVITEGRNHPMYARATLGPDWKEKLQRYEAER